MQLKRYNKIIFKEYKSVNRKNIGKNIQLFSVFIVATAVLFTVDCGHVNWVTIPYPWETRFSLLKKRDKDIEMINFNKNNTCCITLKVRKQQNPDFGKLYRSNGPT